MSLSDKKGSKVWLYFSPKGRDGATCNMCKQFYAAKGGNTSNLSKHLAKKHKIYVPGEKYEQMFDKVGIVDTQMALFEWYSDGHFRVIFRWPFLNDIPGKSQGILFRVREVWNNIQVALFEWHSGAVVCQFQSSSGNAPVTPGSPIPAPVTPGGREIPAAIPSTSSGLPASCTSSGIASSSCTTSGIAN